MTFLALAVFSVTAALVFAGVFVFVDDDVASAGVFVFVDDDVAFAGVFVFVDDDVPFAEVVAFDDDESPSGFVDFLAVDVLALVFGVLFVGSMAGAPVIASEDSIFLRGEIVITVTED